MLNLNSFSNINSPRYVDLNGTLITVNCDVESVGTNIPFTASPDDKTTYGPLIFQRALNGDYGDVAAYVEPERAPEQIIASNTSTYNRLLRATTDAAFPLQSAVTLGVATDEQKYLLAELQQYSVQLMGVDLTASPVVWPEEPTSLK